MNLLILTDATGFTTCVEELGQLAVACAKLAAPVRVDHWQLSRGINPGWFRHQPHWKRQGTTTYGA